MGHRAELHDQDELVEWARTAKPAPGIVYVNHGEPAAASALAGRLELDAGLTAIVVQAGERVRIGSRNDSGHSALA